MLRLRKFTRNDKRMLHTAVVSFGDGSSGALGHTDSFASDSYEPKQVTSLPSDISTIACGHYHSLAVSQTGQVWAWGRNNEGQLGRGHKSILSEASFRAQLVNGLQAVRVRAASGSGVVSMAVDEDGSLWTWGSSKRGQLGLGAGVTSALLPRKVDGLAGKPIAQVSLGWGHALACTVDGELYSWGYHDNGRLGYLLAREEHVSDESSPSSEDVGERMLKQRLAKEDSQVLQWEPKLVEALQNFKIVGVACGLDHSLALAETGKLFSFGDNTMHQLGREDNELPGTVNADLVGKKIVSVAAGWGHSLAVDDLGAVYSWGWSSGSQLGRTGSSSVPGKVEEEEFNSQKVVAVAAARAHSLALTSTGQVWSWGSGKNGRLGLGSSIDEALPYPVECLEHVQQAVCGFDHSLVLVSQS